MLRASLALLLATAMLSDAQNVGDRDYRLAVNVELVQLFVSVVDKKGRPVRDLEQEHFSVYEDAVPQKISLFNQEDVPLSVGIVIDASSSMSSKRSRVNTAAMTFFRESNPEDETAILSFSDKVNLERDFTADTRLLRGALKRIVSSEGTALYDAVVAAARHLSESSSHKKKVLIVISDGEDNVSKYTLEQTLTIIRNSRITLYAVGLLTSDPVSSGFRGRTFMEQLADATGGVSYFPKNVRDVEDVCKSIARDLRNQYTIGYKPSNDKLDGAWRRISVQVNPPNTVPGIKVRTKQGYFAPVAHVGRDANVISQ